MHWKKKEGAETAKAEGWGTGVQRYGKRKVKTPSPPEHLCFFATRKLVPSASHTNIITIRIIVTFFALNL